MSPDSYCTMTVLPLYLRDGGCVSKGGGGGCSEHCTYVCNTCTFTSVVYSGINTVECTQIVPLDRTGLRRKILNCTGSKYARVGCVHDCTLSQSTLKLHYTTLSAFVGFKLVMQSTAAAAKSARSRGWGVIRYNEMM